MFQRIAVVLALAGLMFSLSACGKSGGSGLPVVSSPNYGTVPEITFPRNQPPKSSVVKVLDEGNGKGQVIKDGDFVVVDYYGKVWGGSVLPDSTISKPTAARGISLADPPIKGWLALRGAKTGERLLLIVPPDQAYGELGSESIGVKKGDTLAYVVDVRLKVSPDDAAQFEITPTGLPLPSGVKVSVGSDHDFSLDASTDGDAPTKEETFVYATGNGPQVQPGETVVLKQIQTDWGQACPDGAWDDSKMYTASADSLKLANLGLGSVVVVTYPATSSANARVALMQIVAKYNAEH